MQLTTFEEAILLGRIAQRSGTITKLPPLEGKAVLVERTGGKVPFDRYGGRLGKMIEFNGGVGVVKDWVTQLLDMISDQEASHLVNGEAYVNFVRASSGVRPAAVNEARA